MSQTYDPTLPASGVTTFGELYQILRDKSEALRSFFEGTSFPSNPIVGQGCYRSDLKKFFIYSGDAILGVNGWVEIFISISGHGLDVVTAAGTKTSLTERLAVSLNDDGTLKSTVAAYQSEWITPSLTFTYVNANTFTVSGDQTDIYVQYRRVKFNHTTSATTYSTISAATYSTATASTTVTVSDTVISSDLVSVSYGIITADRTKDSMPRNIATTDLTNVLPSSVVTNLLAAEVVNTQKAQGGFLRAKDIIPASIVINGFDLSTSTASPDTLYVANGVGLLKQTNNSVYTYEKLATSFVASTAGVTYYLYLLPDGTWYWATTLPSDANALPIAEVITSTAGGIASVTDKRKFLDLFTSFTSPVVLARPGYQQFADNLIMQWGRTSVAANSTVTVPYPVVFPHECFIVVATDYVSAQRTYSSVIFNIYDDTFEIINSTSTVAVVVGWLAMGW